MNRYQVVSHLSAGAHGVILKAVDTLETATTDRRLDVDQKKLLAIKRIFIKSSGRATVPLSIVREIKSLQFLRNHDHIISLNDVFALGSSVNLVFPLLPLNLTTLIYDMELTTDQCILYTRMLLEGVYHCHVNGILHRDLKPANLLIDWNGILKICDFGQARAIPDNDCQGSQDQQEFFRNLGENGNSMLSHQVCTRWYRCPELLYGSNNYDYAIDMWSVGCIIGELLQKWPLFKGSSDIEQLGVVVTALGDPPESWAKQLPDYNKITFTKGRRCSSLWLRKLRRKCNEALGVDLVGRLCRYTDRLSAEEALAHPFVQTQLTSNCLIRPTTIKHLIGPPKIGK